MHIIMSICSLMAVGCSSNDEPTFVAGQPVTVDFAYTFSSSANPSTTRQVTEVVQPNNAAQPRLPETMRIITMMDTNPSESDFNWEAPVPKSDPAARFYYTNNCQINTGVNRCLVYGKPADKNKDGVATYVYNGVITENFPSSIANASDIQAINFSLVPIYNVDINNDNKLDIPDDASILARYLTDVANTTVANTTGWSASGNAAIQELRQKFLNRGNDLPGSAASVKAWLEALAGAAQSLINSGGYSDQETTLLTAIKTNASTKADAITSTVTYPRSINLPDGAAALRWVEVESEKAFKPQMYTTTTVDDINTVSRFAYPASLYYFVNSGISTSMEAVDYEAIYASATTTTDPDKTAWEHVLDNFTDGPTVEGGTRSVALTNPVQYAVGQLQVNVQASSETLKDNNDMDVTLGTNFPLKGIIVGGQRQVDYEFKQTENTDSEVKFLYDSQVESGCYLSTTSQLGCQTLVLQSYDGENVDIVLEFENKSGVTFTGVNGCYVYPHTRFYLVGKIQWTPKQNIVDDKDKRVFTKDHITTVNLTVTSLKKAYNLLPSLLTGHLELGIEVSDWVAATPEVVILK